MQHQLTFDISGSRASYTTHIHLTLHSSQHHTQSNSPPKTTLTSSQTQDEHLISQQSTSPLTTNYPSTYMTLQIPHKKLVLYIHTYPHRHVHYTHQYTCKCTQHIYQYLCHYLYLYIYLYIPITCLSLQQ